MNNRRAILVYGYGNIGRGDDGVGVAFADAIERKKLPGVTVERNYQLNVEDAFTAAQYDIVIFSDASYNDISAFQFSSLVPSKQISFSTHAMAPGSVLSLCIELYGKRPLTYLMEIRGYDYGMQEKLSPKTDENLHQAIDFITPLLKTGTNAVFEKAARNGARGSEVIV
jgi:hydrogenase maturation protease